MKILTLKTNRILMLFCILMLTVLSFSCSKDKDDDDDNNKTSTSLIGKWTWEDTGNSDGVTWRDVIVLNFIDASKGTYSYYWYENGNLDDSVSKDFTYFTKSGILTTGVLNDAKYTVKNSTLTLVFEENEYNEEYTMVFKKI